MKFHLILLMIVLCASKSFAQSAVGASCGLRVFPLQHFRNENDHYYYNKNSDSYNVHVSNALENTARLYFETSFKAKNKRYSFGVNIYSATLDFQVNMGGSYGNADVQGSWSTQNESRISATYHYTFVGADFGRIKVVPVSEKFSFNLGYNLSLHFLVYEKTTNKSNVATSTYHSASYDGSYSTTTTTTTVRKLEDVHNLPFNIKFELPFGFTYQSNMNTFRFLAIAGISTQSRMLVNPKGFNLYFLPQLSYTWVFQKKTK